MGWSINRSYLRTKNTTKYGIGIVSRATAVFSTVWRNDYFLLLFLYGTSI
ncbi:hypothetical protein MGSAQ_000367 [marine sediment metagenome]|uniref:Uncharacterized protein n=1 Tax=marine sediment metagenome TaxID=412755 RepID=A0A1B6NXH6_9ZZZZ